MMKILLAAFVLLLIPASAAYGQVVETKGQNYDLVENFFTGEAIWNSTPERIMDGGWQNYALSNTAEKVIFNTNSVGSFVFDKNSCSYSIYENGFDGEQIIPSVSAVATYLNNGQWQNLPINDEACTVTVDRYEDGVYLTSTKVITEDITEDVFIPYTGTTQNFYVNATNANFDLIQSSNGTNTGYFNGETITTTGIEVEKFVQEIRLDIRDGFKETFKVIHDGNQELGISQTIHTGESITIGETVIDIAELNGQSFDRQFIIDNQAEILAITDSVNYDFDTGIESLSNVNIIFDGDYKVNLDYANGNDDVPFVGYLEIDPTFSSNYSHKYGAYSDAGYGSSCPPISGIWSTGYVLLESVPTSSGTHRCYSASVEYDTTSIPDSATITDTVLTWDIAGIANGGRNCEFNSMETQPSTFTNAQSLWNDSTGDDGLGNTYVGNSNVCTSTGVKVIDLGVQSDSDLQTQLSSDWFGVGLSFVNYNSQSADTRTWSNSGSNTVQLEVTYEIPIAPQPPTGLTTVTGIPLELDWTAPVDNGGSAITGYKVYRTLNEFALTELPNNSGSDSQITFTDNEFLLHGFETGSVTPTYTADLSTSSWTNGGTSGHISTDTTNEEIDFTWTTDNGDKAVSYYDLTTVSDTQWTLRSQLDIDTVSQGVDVGDVFFFYGIGSSNQDGGEVDDFLGLMMRVDNTKTDIFAVDTNGSAPNNESTTLFTRQLQQETLYVEMKRTSETEFIISLFDNADYSGTALESQTITTTSSVSGLQYVKTSGIQGFSDSELIGSVSNIKFYNDMTTTTEVTLPDKSTNSISPLGSSGIVEGSWEDVVWDSTTASGGTISGNTFSITANTWYDGIARSVQTINPATGGGEMICTKTVSPATMCGFKSAGTFNTGSNIFADAEYMMYSNKVYESGTGKGSYSTTSSSELKAVMDSNGLVTYYVDGTLVYTSTITASGDYYVLGVGENSGGTVTAEIKVNSLSSVGSSTTGVIDTGLQSPNLSFTDSNLPDGTDDFSVGSWVKLDMSRDSTYDGTNNGATTGVTGKINNAWSFDGSNDYISIPKIQSYNSAYSFNVWINGDIAEYRTIASFGGGNDSTSGGMLKIKGTNDAYFSTGSSVVYCGGTNGLSALRNANVWQMVTVTFDGSTAKVYKDGSQLVSCSMSPSDPSSDIMIGKRDSGDYFDGKMEQILYYDKALSSSEISALYNSGSGTSTPDTNGLVAHYDFEQTGTTLENQVVIPPTNTKLLGLNDVTFNVGTTTASVGTSTPVSWTTSGTQTSISGGQVNVQNPASNGDYTYKQLPSTVTDFVLTFDFEMIQTGTAGNGESIFIGNTNAMPLPNPSKVTFALFNGYQYLTCHNVSSYCSGGGWATNSGMSYPVGQYYITMTKSGSTCSIDAYTDSARTVSYGSGVSISTCGTTNGFNYIGIGSQSDAWQKNYVVDNVEISSGGSVILTETFSPSVSNIISATGLSDNTSSPQHYTFTRDGNDWEIYQNGVSEATATDSTSLGSNGITGFASQAVTWDSTTSSGMSISGDTITKTAGNGWSDGIAQSTQTINPATGGGEVTFTKSLSNAQGGLSKDPYWTSGVVTASGDYMMYDDAISELGAEPSGATRWSGGNDSTVHKITMDSNGLVKYYVDGTLHYTSTVTASGDYYVQGIAYGQNDFVTASITSYGIEQPYTTNIDGMIDEYFINSDVLTSSEVDTIYERGVAPTLLTTVTATEHDDSTVVGGNSYFYSLKSTNIIGDSDFLTPYVSGLAGTPPNAPVISTAINNPNTTPLEITVSISPDAVVGSGTLTGFEIYRDGVLVDTVGLVSSVPNTVPSGGGTFEFSAKSISTHGTSVLSNLSSITTPSVPDAPSLTLSINNPNPNPLDITATFVAPSNAGGSAVTSYNLLHSTDDVTYTPVATNVTPDSTYTVSAAGLHYFKAQANNLIGSSLESAAVSINTPSVPDAPVTVSTSIGNPNANPLDIVVGFSASPNDQGSGITGYKVYRSIDDVTYTEITTLGNSVYSYADTVTVSGGYYYKVSSLNNVGEGLQSAYSLINTPTVPDAPVLTSGAVSSTQIDSTWTTPSNGNSEIVSYEISVDGTVSNIGLVNADSQTGLTQNTAYEIKIRAVNNVGTSAWSNAITSTTNIPPSGTNTISLNNSWGDVVIVDNTITVTGNPTPTLDKIEFILDTDIVSTVNNPSLTGTYAITLPDTVQHGLLVRVTASNGDTVYYDSNSITITGTTVYRVDAAEGGNTVAYTTARTPHPTNDALDQIELKWAKDTFPFDGSCTFMSPSQALEVRDLNNLPSSLSFTDQNGVNIYDTTVNISEKNNAYVYCWSGDDLQFGAQSEALGSNALLAGLSGLDSGLGTTTVDPVTGAETSYSILGAPMIVIFVLLIAGQATGRTAPTFIIIILAAVGILMGLGFFIIDEGIFGLILIMGAMGVMIGKKFL